jgi:hypothetical protein
MTVFLVGVNLYEPDMNHALCSEIRASVVKHRVCVTNPKCAFSYIIFENKVLTTPHLYLASAGKT